MLGAIAAVMLMAQAHAPASPPATKEDLEAALTAVAQQNQVKENSEWIRWSIVSAIGGLVLVVGWFARGTIKSINDANAECAKTLIKVNTSLIGVNSSLEIVHGRLTVLEEHKRTTEQRESAQKDKRIDQLEQELKDVHEQGRTG